MAAFCGSIIERRQALHGGVTRPAAAAAACMAALNGGTAAPDTLGE